MSGFLHRLVGRASGAVPPLHAVTRPLFAPRAVAAHDMAPAASDAVSGAPGRAWTVPAPLADLPAARPDDERGGPPPNHTIASARPTTTIASPPAPPDQRPPSPVHEPLVGDRTPSARRDARPRGADATSASAAVASAADLLPRAELRAHAATPLRMADDRAAAAEAEVHVSIGRIEITAPPPAPPRAAPQGRRPMSLAEYLERRQRGR